MICNTGNSKTPEGFLYATINFRHRNIFWSIPTCEYAIGGGSGSIPLNTTNQSLCDKVLGMFGATSEVTFTYTVSIVATRDNSSIGDVVKFDINFYSDGTIHLDYVSSMNSNMSYVPGVGVLCGIFVQ